MALSAFGPSWTDGVRVQERKLQEYMFQQNHMLQLQGAAETLKHTLEACPTTTASDGLVHLGDSLMLRNACTGGLLQGDIEDKVDIQDASRTPSVGAALSTGLMLHACARNVYTLSRVSDTDAFAADGYLHYGQVIRLAASPILAERQLYLFSADRGSGDACQMCLYPRATMGSQWRVVRAQPPPKGEPADDDRVHLGAPIRLESVATSQALGSDEALRMTSYGNEFHVFGRSPASVGSSTVLSEVAQSVWAFVDTQWAEEVIAAARKASGAEYVPGEEDLAHPEAAKYLAGLYIPKGWGSDPGHLLQSSETRAIHDLAVLDGEHGSAGRKVLARIFPLIRRAGMHVARGLRRMCVQADTQTAGVVSLRTFAGILSWSAIRLQDPELYALLDILAPEQVQPSECIDYRRFFALMGPPLGQVRGAVVRDAYAKLRDEAAGNLVEVLDLQRKWDPQCHPEVQSGKMAAGDAREEFLRQWDIAHADALVSYEEFLDYYQDVSLAVETDEIFVEIVRRAWGL